MQLASSDSSSRIATLLHRLSKRDSATMFGRLRRGRGAHVRELEAFDRSADARRDAAGIDQVSGEIAAVPSASKYYSSVFFSVLKILHFDPAPLRVECPHWPDRRASFINGLAHLLELAVAFHPVTLRTLLVPYVRRLRCPVALADGPVEIDPNQAVAQFSDHSFSRQEHRS